MKVKGRPDRPSIGYSLPTANRRYSTLPVCATTKVVHPTDLSVTREQISPSTYLPDPGKLPPMADETAGRIDKLESHIAHLEHQVEQLNGVIIEQGKLLERLKREVQRQSNAMQTMELDRIKANIQKPPHYQ